MMKVDEVVCASDVTLNCEELENQKKTLRAKIKVARRNLTQEINHWDKDLLKYEKKKTKDGSLIEASSKVSQESLLHLLAVVTSSLESLVYLCGNLEASDSAILEKWLDELLEEMDSQKDIVNDVIEQLSDLSEALSLIHI